MKLGRFTLRGELGRGGVGVVYRGVDPAGREVAVKVMIGTRSGASERFAREARLHELLGEAAGFVPLLDVGEVPQGSYLVMPLLGGGTLRDRVAEGPLPLDQVVALGAELAAALGRAHAAGIVHRDVKPDNVLFTDAGEPLLADLGLAKHFRQDVSGASQSVALSRAGEMRGTVGYMAPEQLSDATAVGPPADVFAMGALLYEAIAGAPAFEAESLVGLMAQIAGAHRLPLRSLRPECPGWLATVVDRALAVDPARRYADGAALAEALRAGPRARLHPGLVLSLLLGVALLVGLTAFAIQRRGPAPTPSPTPSPSAAPSPGSWGDDPAGGAPPETLPYPPAFKALAEATRGKRARLLGVCAPSSATPALALGMLPDGRPFAVEPLAVHAFHGPTQPGSVVIATPKAGSRFRGAFVGETRLATIGRYVRVWDLADAGPVASLELEADAEHVALSPAGTSVFFGYQGKAYLGPIALGVSPQPLRVGEHRERVSGVAAGPRGFVSVGGSAVLLLHDVEGKVVGRIPSPEVIVGVAYVPGAPRLVTLDLRGELREWTAMQQEAWKVRVLRPGERARQLAISPDGRLAALTSEAGAVHLVDLAAHQSVQRIDLSLAGEDLTCVAFAQGGAGLLLGTARGAVAVFALEDPSDPRAVAATPPAAPALRPRGRGGVPLGRQAEAIGDLALLPDGTPLSAGTTRVHLWDAATGALQRSFPVGGELSALRVLPDGRVLTLGGGRSLRIWDLEHDPPREVTRIGLPFVPRDVSLDPTGRRAAILGKIGSLELWDLQARERLWRRAPDGARRVLLLGDGRVVLGYRAGALARLDAHGALQQRRRAGRGAIDALVRFGPRDYLAACGGAVVAIDPTKRGPLWLSANGGVTVTDLALRGERVLATTDLGDLWCLDARQVGRRLWERQLDVGATPRVRFAGEGRALVGGAQRRLTLLDLEQGKELWSREAEPHRAGVLSLGFDVKGLTLASAGGRGVSTWKLSGAGLEHVGRREVVELAGAAVAGPHMAFIFERLERLRPNRPDPGFQLRVAEPQTGRLADLPLKGVRRIATSGDGAYAFLGLAKEGLMLKLGVRVEEVARLSLPPWRTFTLSHDGRLLALQGALGVTLFDPRSGRKVQEWPEEQGAPTIVQSATGASLIAFARRGAVALVDAIRAQTYAGVVLRAPPLRVHAAGKGRLLTYAESRGVELWALTPGEAEALGRLDLEDPTDAPTALAVSPGGERIGVGTARGRVLVFDAP